MDTGRIRARFFILFLALTLPFPSGAVVVENAQELRDAIRSDNIQPPVDLIEFSGVIELDRLAESPNALPALGNRSMTIRGLEDAELRATGAGYRLMEVHDSGVLRLEDLTITGFSSNDSGGALHINDESVRINDVTFRDNHSAVNGGALAILGRDARVEVSDTRFEGNTADGRGGAVHLRNTVSNIKFNRVQFIDNEAFHGCAVSHRASANTIFRSSVFRGPCDAALVDATFGRQDLHFVGNTFVAQGGWAFRFRADAADEPDANEFIGNVFVQAEDPGFELCHEVGGNAAESPLLRSRGHNAATDPSCGLDQATDVIAANAQEILANPPAPDLLASGPGVDAVELPTVGAESGEYLCDVADTRGLGTPQDGNGDGLFACDLGAFERRRGPDIGAAQSGAYFDPERPGEGYFVEILEDGRAWVTFFTYERVAGSPPTPKHPAWFFGTGKVVGNSVVVPEMFISGGTRFGDEFDPDDVSTFRAANLSLVFPGCQASAEAPGNSYLRGDNVFNVPGDFVMNTRAVRLSRIVPCGQETADAPSGLSGNFFDPDRAGEGISVQRMPDGRVLVIWYTFSTDGRQLWLISDGATLDGNTITAPMVFAAEPTAFGRNFNPDEIELEPWGTLTLEYTDCDNLELSYESEVEGYGSGSFQYTRLTKPAGTECPAF